MGILPIGFFSPLPLAMMIPFMATQSLAMGEAFGKSFQYGKRKISSMSNEEFNKLTFRDLMVEQTANIKAIVPELSKQMAQSKEMQGAIFQEMVNLIPTFFDSLFSAIDPKHIENPTQTSQASPPPAITEIRYYNDRSGESNLNPDAIEEYNKLIDKLLEQQGTKESLAEKLRLENLPPPPPAYTTPPEKLIASSKVLSASQDQVYIDWITKLGKLKAEYQTADRIVKDNLSAYTKRRTTGQTNAVKAQVVKYTTYLNRRRATTRLIRLMSNDYRNPNNHIRENALRLRQAMANGQWI